MKILAFDTSGKAVSVAAAEDMRLRSVYWLSHGRTHAEMMMTCIDAVLSGLNMEPRDFDAFAAITGPGSFTGLRIGIAAVKAMAYACGAGTIGIMTADALAKNLEGIDNALICPLICAKNGYVYQALYRSYKIYDTDESWANCIVISKNEASGNIVVRIAEAEMLTLAAAAERINLALDEYVSAETVIINGDAAEAHYDFFDAHITNAPCLLAGERDLLQSASSAALLACEAFAKGRAIPPGRLVPEYLNAGYFIRGGPA